ncbi:MAG: GIY-YIG nuclease family protein [Thermomicrobiales bacterium]
MRDSYVYFLASATRTRSTGVTNDLECRLWEHRQPRPSSFTSRYRVTRLVFYETFADPRDAIARENEIKGWLRAKKIALIEETNPEWRDLGEGWFDRDSSS